MPESETTLHRDTHLDADHEHVTLVTEDVVATFHRNRDELATVLDDNITVISDREKDDALIDALIETAQGTVAPIIKYNTSIHHAVRWGCLACDSVYDQHDPALGTPLTCTNCDALLVREGSQEWLAHTEFPDKRLFK